MPKITAISQQVKRQDRYSIYIDGEYSLSLSSAQLLESAIATGDELEPKRIVELVELSGYGKMLDRAYNYLSFRPRSTKEARDYLSKKGCDQPTITKIIDALTDQKLLDDRNFADIWVTERRQFQLKSRRQLEYELRQKGIDKDVIEGSLSEITDRETSTIKELVEKKSLINKYGSKQKLISYLGTKGFSYNDIRAALEQLEQES